MRTYSKSHRRRHEPLVDALPEQFAYRDTGCEVSPSCLRCPLPRCKYDDPIWYQQYRRQRRDLQLIRALQTGGSSVPELARQFGISTRTVHRALLRARAPAPVRAEQARLNNHRGDERPGMHQHVADFLLITSHANI